jgi:parallel beta-helix repeat protein
MTFRWLRETTRRREPGDVRAVTARAWVLVLAGLVTGIVPPATASDLCGTTILANLTLDHDLTCSGNGLIVGADGVTIDLNGHTITGSGTGNGILATGRSGVVITGGTIRNFTIGVQLVASTGVLVKEIRAIANRDGIFLIASSGNTITENFASQNSRVGVMLRPGAINNSTQNLVTENILSDNTNGVILVETPSANIFKENIITGSSNAGIALNGGVSGNLIQENAFTGNAAGILLNVGATGLWPTANTFVENTIAMNTCGVSGPPGDNTFKENVLEGNLADACF